MALTKAQQQSQQETLDYLDMYPYRVTSLELAMALGISVEAASWRLRRLWLQGRVQRRQGRHLRGSKYEWEYDLLDDMEEAA